MTRGAMTAWYDNIKISRRILRSYYGTTSKYFNILRVISRRLIGMQQYLLVYSLHDVVYYFIPWQKKKVPALYHILRTMDLNNLILVYWKKMATKGGIFNIGHRVVGW